MSTLHNETDLLKELKDMDHFNSRTCTNKETFGCGPCSVQRGHMKALFCFFFWVGGLNSRKHMSS